MVAAMSKLQKELDRLIQKLEQDPNMEIHLIFNNPGELKYAHEIRKYLHGRFPEATFKFMRPE